MQNIIIITTDENFLKRTAFCSNSILRSNNTLPKIIKLNMRAYRTENVTDTDLQSTVTDMYSCVKKKKISEKSNTKHDKKKAYFVEMKSEQWSNEDAMK